MGSLNEFVDANIATLHMLMQEKSKILMYIEEKKIERSSALQETVNYKM